MVGALVDAVRGAGLKPASIDLDAFALVRALAPPESSEDTRVYCHISSVVNLAVALGSTCLFTRPLVVSRDEGRPVPASLAEEIRLSIDFYMTQADARPVAEVVLSGPGSTGEGLAGELQAILDLEVSVAEPLANLEVAALPAAEDPHRHTVAAGLALGAAA